MQVATGDRTKFLPRLQCAAIWMTKGSREYVLRDGRRGLFPSAFPPYSYLVVKCGALQMHNRNRSEERSCGNREVAQGQQREIANFIFYYFFLRRDLEGL
jgi:hypothetical protein